MLDVWMFVSSFDEAAPGGGASSSGGEHQGQNVDASAALGQRPSYFYSAEVEERMTEVQSPSPNPASARQSNRDAGKSVQSKYQTRVI